MDDRTAISRLKQGDLNGLETLVSRYQSPAVHAAYLIVYERALAEDIVQSAFVKVAEKIHQFDDELPFASWFFRIVLNDALKLARKQKRNVSLEYQFDEPTMQLSQWFTDPHSRPEQLIEQQQTREIILQAIELLTPEQRTVVTMRYFLDMSEVDISIKMDRPLSTIKWWLREARKRLKNLVSSRSGVKESNPE